MGPGYGGHPVQNYSNPTDDQNLYLINNDQYAQLPDFSGSQQFNKPITTSHTHAHFRQAYDAPDTLLRALDQGAPSFISNASDRGELVLGYQPDLSGQQAGGERMDGSKTGRPWMRVGVEFCDDCSVIVRRQQDDGGVVEYPCLCGPRTVGPQTVAPRPVVPQTVAPRPAPSLSAVASQPAASQSSATTLDGIQGFTNAFEDKKKAREYMRKPKHSVEIEEDEDDWKDVQKDQKRWAKKIFDAIVTLPDDASESSQRLFKTIETKGFKQKYIEASAWAVVARTLHIHRFGSELQSKVQLQGNKIDQYKATERLKKLVNMLLNHKTIAKDVLDGWKLKVIVDQPAGRLKLAQDSLASNINKYNKQNELKKKIAEIDGADEDTPSAVSLPSNSKIDTRKDKSAMKGPAESGKEPGVGPNGEQMEKQPGGDESLGEDEVDWEGPNDSEIEEQGSDDEDGVDEFEPQKAARSKSLSTPKEAGGVVKKGKNVAKATATGKAVGQAPSQSGQKRKRGGGHEAVASSSEAAASGGRNLRSRHV